MQPSMDKIRESSNNMLKEMQIHTCTFSLCPSLSHPATMQEKTSIVVHNSASLGLNINREKSKVLKINIASAMPITLGEEAQEEVDSFPYLSKVGAAFLQLKNVWWSSKDAGGWLDVPSDGLQIASQGKPSPGTPKGAGREDQETPAAVIWRQTWGGSWNDWLRTETFRESLLVFYSILCASAFTVALCVGSEVALLLQIDAYSCLMKASY